MKWVVVPKSVPKVQRSAGGGWICGAIRVVDPIHPGRTVALVLASLWDGGVVLGEPCRHDSREVARSCPDGAEARAAIRRHLRGGAR